jgi:hypothetical protein
MDNEITLKDFMEKFESWEDEERGKIMGIVPLLTSISRRELQQFQNNWDPDKPFSEFTLHQNTLLKQCILLEMSSLGVAARTSEGLELLTPDTVITLPESVPLEE